MNNSTDKHFLRGLRGFAGFLSSLSHGNFFVGNFPTWVVKKRIGELLKITPQNPANPASSILGRRKGRPRCPSTANSLCKPVKLNPYFAQIPPDRKARPTPKMGSKRGFRAEKPRHPQCQTLCKYSKLNRFYDFRPHHGLMIACSKPKTSRNAFKVVLFEQKGRYRDQKSNRVEFMILRYFIDRRQTNV